jgi:NADH dehydrogenase (ubiquinone) 1 alpha subcomplex subunit 8
MGVEETSPLQERPAPITTSAVLMAASKHIASKCGAHNRAFLDCKRNDPDPERCLRQGQDVTGCVISL